MQILLKRLTAVGVLIFSGLALQSAAQTDNGSDKTEPELHLFAVEVRVGPNWDNAKAPGEQAFFSEHSANLKRHRDAGHIVMGARYSDIGLIIFSAASADAVKAMMDEDPSMAAGTFRYAVHAMNVFYPGLVQPGSRP